MNWNGRELIDTAFQVLVKNATKAAESLTALLDTPNPRLKRLVCNDVIAHTLHYKEVRDLSERLTAIEEKNLGMAILKRFTKAH